MPVCLYFAAEQSNRATPSALSPIPASLVLLPHRCLLQWDCPACSSLTNSSKNPAYLSIHIVFFQSTSPFSLLEAWTMFKSHFRFSCSLSDWLLLLLLTAITSVLCIIKKSFPSELSAMVTGNLLYVAFPRAGKEGTLTAIG